MMEYPVDLRNIISSEASVAVPRSQGRRSGRKNEILHNTTLSLEKEQLAMRAHLMWDTRKSPFNNRSLSGIRR